MAVARAIVAKTPLDARQLRFASMSGREEISRCFAFSTVFVTEDMEIDAKDLLGKDVTITLSGGASERFFHGYVDAFSLSEFGRERFEYVAVLRPWLWFLSKTTDNRIFQNKSVVDIVEEVFSAYPLAKFEKRLQATYPPREYCVQYGETDLDFVQRLLEHEGIFYFFEHADGEHRLILCDTMSKLKPVDGYETIPYRSDTDSGREGEEGILRWRRTELAVSGGYTQTDYDFVKPASDLEVRRENAFPHDQASNQLYHYPGNYIDVGRGETLAAVRLEEVQASHQRVEAASSAVGPWPGSTFKMEFYPREAENDEYLVLSASYQMSDAQYRSGGGQNGGFSASYALIPKSLPFRPDRLAPKPVMKGPQTAVVVGPAGEEIYTDEYSRVKVQFHWDRLGKKDEKTTCFIRVSSVWAGSGWGFIQIPRIGQEVIVDFLEGDPDQPIITGRVYNAAQMPPYGLPGSATQSGWKSNSSPGGGGWNELRFEDRKGAEEVYFQAEKDHNELVKNDESRTIGHDFLEDVGNDATQNIGHDRIETVSNNKSTDVGVNRTVTIGSNDTESVGVDRSLSVGSNETISVGSNSTETIGVNHTQSVGSAQTLSVGTVRSRTVGAAETVAVGAAQSINVGAARSVAVGAAQSHTVAADDTWTVGASQSVTVASDQSFSVGSNQSSSIGADRSVTVGKNSSHGIGEAMTIDVGKTLAITAADEITLTCGSASVTMKKDGTIVVKGKDISIDGSGKINVKASGDITMKGSKINQN